MRKLTRSIWLIVLAVVVMSPSIQPAQGLSEGFQCPVIVQNAWDATDALCADTGRNQACYGHVLLDAQAQVGVTSFAFDQEGDQVNVADMQSLRLSAMDSTTGVWGVALMRLQANLPASQADQNATLLLFGDVKLESAASEVPEITVTAAAKERNVNVRQLPYLDAWVMDSLSPGQTAVATGRLEDSSWLRVQMPDSGVTGWVFSPLLASDEPVESLAVVGPSEPYYGPMQAFMFESGRDDALCPEAPNSGLLIQTPEGVGKVTLLINEVDIQLGSTVYFQAQPNGEMVVVVVEGSARVQVGTVVRYVVPGGLVRVPLGSDGRPSGPPGQIEPYVMDDGLMALPLAQLPRAVSLRAPLTAAELAALRNPPAEEEDTSDVQPTEEAEGEGETPGDQPAGGTGETPSGGGEIAGGGETPDGGEEPAQPQVTLCNKGHTITVAAPAVEAFLAQGATLGACP